MGAHHDRLSETGSSGAEPVVLYRGFVFHARLAPKPHRFRYRVFSILIDLDRLAQAGRASRLFSVNRLNLLSFHERDHGGADGSPLRSHVDRVLKQAGLPPPARVLLLCYPRVLGFAFNPLSVYFCRHADGSPAAMIYEVRNTFGERHSYVLPVAPDSPSASPLRQTARKTFHVSPFLGMDQRYHFRVSDPGERIDLHILQREGDRPILATGFSGMRKEVTGKGIGAAFLAVPLMTLKVVAAIFWEAARLWWKGLEVHPHPGRMKAGREAQGRTVP